MLWYSIQYLLRTKVVDWPTINIFRFQDCCVHWHKCKKCNQKRHSLYQATRLVVRGCDSETINLEFSNSSAQLLNSSDFLLMSIFPVTKLLGGGARTDRLCRGFFYLNFITLVFTCNAKQIANCSAVSAIFLSASPLCISTICWTGSVGNTNIRAFIQIFSFFL